MNKSKLSLYAVLFSLFTYHLPLTTPLYAAGPGTSSAAFLKLGFGARPLALGESYVAIADDAAALHYNPAGLAYPSTLEGEGGGEGERPYELLVSHALHIQDIRISQIGLTRRPFGFYLNYLSVGGIEARTAETAVPDSTFYATDFALGASYGRMISPGLGAGLSARFIRQNIKDKSAQAVSADAGLLYRFENLPLSLGISACNMGTKIKFDQEGYPLPFIIRAGAAAEFGKKSPVSITAQADFSRDSSAIVRTGMEYRGFGPFALRTGYMFVPSSQRRAVLGKSLGTTASGISEFYGLFMGLGFKFRS
ncbi:MAG: PorV/PorQ family protein, partial [bacterium]